MVATAMLTSPGRGQLVIPILKPDASLTKALTLLLIVLS